ncbi:PEP-CTERM sorting domain-containing protein [Roseofilum sp. BLCC_M154]|uniref:PEP-CTERM sorting domain-containing protein n=1 Tax=Roseofilum acuticapitatum BLCC-M154 TaxID=3022444 RepID=A0ABT7AXY5_9CYAN|nr:PEP-CTERM sorting domain-containing protein [Roseofilum acuticapitatum]MDJ1171156.1 PEP-CTERM sorting domain-containing protein [Roseofilum acuticapitatum BLCC-M154]
MNTTKTLVITAATSIFALVATQPSAQAYRLFFGEDLNNSSYIPLSETPNASAAQDDFLSGLVGVGVETFEGFSDGTTGPVDLDFGVAGVATLQGNGEIEHQASGTSAAGRYGVSGDKFWEGAARSGAFSIDFSQEVAAFGFNGVDIGDFGGQLSLILDLVNGGQTTVTVPNTVGSSGSTDGSVLYFGLIAENDDELFNGLSFSMTTGQGDWFAFDNMTIGSKEQVASTPEPASMLGLLAVGAMGVVAGLKRKAN